MERKRFRRSVTASEFILTDDNHVVRCRIGIDQSQSPSVALTDQNGIARLELLLDGNRPFISLSDGNKETRLMLTLGEEEDPRLWMFDGNSENPRIGVLVDRNGTACVEVRSREGEASAIVSVGSDGKSSINMWTEQGRTPAISLRLKPSGEAEFSLWNNDEERIWTVTNQKIT